jgi:serine/threonine-protein phosphatase 5
MNLRICLVHSVLVKACLLLLLKIMLSSALISAKGLSNVRFNRFSAGKALLGSIASQTRKFSSLPSDHPHGALNQTLPASTKERIEALAHALQVENSSHLYDVKHLWSNPIVSRLNELYANNQRVSEEYMHKVLDLSTELMYSFPNIVDVQLHQDPVTNEKTGTLNICGDTHGQYDDFTQIFGDAIGGAPSESNRFLFNGDIADRGPKAVEIFTTLLTMKLINPNAIHILRGNHETKEMTNSYGFRAEVLKKYGPTTLEKFHKFFTSLPFGAVAEKMMFVVHGGLGPQSVHLTIDEINRINRRQDGDNNEVVEEFLWADPRDHVDTFAANHDRGGGILFGPKVTSYFLQKNNLHLLVRSHEMQDHGYSVHHNQQCITIFSAPNYCGVCKNKGAILKLAKTDNASASADTPKLQLSLVQFDAKHPPKRSSPQ